MKKKTNIRWLTKIVLISIVTTMLFTIASTEILGRVGYIVAFTILIAFIVIGVIFDIIGVAVTTAQEAPFHSMASHRQRGSAESLRLIRNADKVASFCNDVVGDVSGIVSGSTAALIAARLMRDHGLVAENLLAPLLISCAVSGLTIGGKAMGKAFAINHNVPIVLRVGKLLNFLRV